MMKTLLLFILLVFSLYSIILSCCEIVVLGCLPSNPVNNNHSNTHIFPNKKKKNVTNPMAKDIFNQMVSAQKEGDNLKVSRIMEENKRVLSSATFTKYFFSNIFFPKLNFSCQYIHIVVNSHYIQYMGKIIIYIVSNKSP